MPTILLRFPAGRYHATAWGHHVNEGITEWPPSPWRLLRALLACGHSTLGWREVPPVGRHLLETLASVLPQYRLPPASLAHSRHYMPLGVLEKGREKTTLVFDTWAQVGGLVAVRWDCELDDDATALLRELADNLGYLGRSESWVDASLVADDVEIPGDRAFPHVEGGERPGAGWEQVALMAAEPPAAYGIWRREVVSRALEAIPLPAGKARPGAALLKKRARAEAPYPLDLLDCLGRDTSWWKSCRWSQPPGARRVLYWRRTDSLEVGPPQTTRRSAAPAVEGVLIAIATPSGRSSSAPSLARTLPQAELLHRALCRKLGRSRCPELTGKDDAGRPLRGHRHAHILPLDLDDDGRVDHFLVHASMGLTDRAQQAIRSLKRTWTKGGAGELQLAIAGVGELEDLRTLPRPLSAGVERVLGPPTRAAAWASLTPFVPPRHLKARGRNTLEGQVLAELVSRGFPEPRVEVLPWDSSPRVLAMRHAVRVRRAPAQRPPSDVGFALRLEFPERVAGPISIGYGSHYGLGLLGALG